MEKVTLEDCEVLSLSTKYIQLLKANRAKESRNPRQEIPDINLLKEILAVNTMLMKNKQEGRTGNQ